ncbi:glycosyltransferase family 4 protein [Sphingomonas sp. HITSZ_GF]|uniref:glycosyltransferase family 4 protein n=1 Tax=Sphingomonas sp. HITSZ_GF TaxID=3037247 RepID=UPI00240E1C1B|nr:glycosyltransferase family 4 protein [Sphingomonas sp. HITSZ_GF]MDG2535767.1 glycosyltransferase family 4 protein [Sphingomonas sp. HITSZ_GF]
MIVVSNGFNRFFLSVIASEIAAEQKLSMFLTGAYPTPRLKSWLSRLGLAGNRKIVRLLGREENIPTRYVRSLWLSEAIYAAREFAGPFEEKLNLWGMKAYGEAAARLLPQAAKQGAKIYHYRAGYGGRSVQVAKDLGMVTICDHSIAHPRYVEELIRHRGNLDKVDPNAPISAVERYIESDFEHADQFLFNSDFVRETFLRLGYPAEKLNVIYWGIDDTFARHIPPRDTVGEGPLHLFVPALNPRKGAPTLAEAMAGLDGVDWRMTIAGSLDDETRESCVALLADPRVTVVGMIAREKMTDYLARCDAVIFPTYAEGSARVIFEALAAGAYVITTPNAGSVIQDGVHGRLVAPGEAEPLRAAIAEVATLRDRIPEIGRGNARMIREDYSQRDYGRHVAALHQRLIAG